jgi:hypothetical protein
MLAGAGVVFVGVLLSEAGQMSAGAGAMVFETGEISSNVFERGRHVV